MIIVMDTHTHVAIHIQQDFAMNFRGLLDSN